MSHHELHSLVILDDVLHQRLLYIWSFLLLFGLRILHVGWPIQVLILTLLVILPMIEVVVGLPLITIVYSSYKVNLIHGLGKLIAHCEFS